MEVTKLGKYEVRATLGRGAVGVVYEAWDPLMARTVAIKVMPHADLDEDDREQYERFRREAQAAGRLHHPNIVSAFDYGETETSAYIVMEFLPGPSLKSLLSKHEALDLDRIGTIMHGLLTGLQHSHGRGVVHRDIKPANIVFSADGEVKITDFGIAHLDTSGMTRAGSVLGTPAYMAPEQVLGDPVDARTDLFSAGVVLYEMLTGRRPFEGSTSSIMHKIVHLEPPQPSRLTATVSAGFDAVIARAIAKNPADRYQSAAAFDEALRAELQRKPALAAAEPPGAPDTTVAVHRPPPPRRQVEPPTPMARASAPARRAPAERSSWPWLVGATGVLALGAAAWLALAPGGFNWRAGLQPSTTAPPQETAVASPPAPTTPTPTTPAPTTPAPTTPAPTTPGPAAEPQRHAKPAPAAAPATPPAQHAAAVPTPKAPETAPPAVPTTTASDALAPLRQQVQAIVATAPCSVITGDVAAGRKVHLHGVSALGEASELEIRALMQRAIQAAVPDADVTWTLQRIDGPYLPRTGPAAPAAAQYNGFRRHSLAAGPSRPCHRGQDHPGLRRRRTARGKPGAGPVRR